MLSFISNIFTRETEVSEKHLRLINQIKNTEKLYYECRKLSDYDGNAEIAEFNERELCEFVVAASKDKGGEWQKMWLLESYISLLLARKLPFLHEEILELLKSRIRKKDDYRYGIGRVNKAVENYLWENELTEELENQIKALIDSIDGCCQTAETRKWIVKLKEFIGQDSFQNPLVAGENWSDSAIVDVAAMEIGEKNSWLELLTVCQTANGAKPTAKWLKTTKAIVEKISLESFKSQVLKWFPLVDKPRTSQIATWSEWSPNPNLLLNDVNADILKGLVWLCAEREDAEIARALFYLAISAYKKVPQVGPRCVRVGNACVWALGAMDGREGVTQLTLLRHKVKGNSVQNLIAAQIQKAAANLNLTPEAVEEMSVPNYGLSEVGSARETFGEFTAELIVTGTNQAEIRWSNLGGKPQKSVPKSVKENYVKELKELNQAAKDIKKMLPAQRDRIENLYLENKTWDFKTWRERYLEHPLVGTIARRLIWRFDETTTAIWHEGKLVDNRGAEMNFFDDTQVELWHPIHSALGEVLEWREFLVEKEIRQPFKQAHREIYLLTEAERNTRVYSNRFAAHVIKQHQFNALCAVRNWKNALWIMADMEVPPASRTMRAHNLRAEFWTEPIGENYQTDATESGTYLYLTTDQVRFYPADAGQHYARGFHYGNNVGLAGQFEPIPLDEIPPLVLSEILRDVDLFVGVCSIGNDPAWMDGGNTNRYGEYWQNFSFGDLSESAKTRRAVLEKLVPRLKIASRCELDEKFLYVRGDIRTYKIHLGSSNILMSPNDQYLCIVASVGAENQRNGKVFLPFEGDRTLAIILSKAFLLAEDKKITDSTITRQIKL